MICLRCSRGYSALSALSVGSRAAQTTAFQNTSVRTFTSITPLRPTISPSAFRLSAVATPITNSSGEVLDLLPKISTHPALAGSQIRCGPRNTFDPSHFVRKRRHGFLSRLRTRKGRATLQRRKNKKRSTLSH